MLKRNMLRPAILAEQQFIRTPTILKCLTADKALLLPGSELRKIPLLFQNPAEFPMQEIADTIISGRLRRLYDQCLVWEDRGRDGLSVLQYQTIIKG